MRALAAAAASAVLLTGCGTDPQDELRALVEDITVEANERDADGVRTRVDDLLSRLETAVADGDVTEEQAAALRDHALAVQAGADAIDPDVVARREAEQAALEAQRRLEEERAAAARAEAERAAQAEQARREAEEKGEDDGKGKGGDKDDEGEGGD